MLDQQKVEAFYKEMSELIVKYGIGAIVGLWFEQTGEGHGYMQLKDLTNSQMHDVCKYMRGKFEGWAGEMNLPTGEQQVHGVHMSKKHQN